MDLNALVFSLFSLNYIDVTYIFTKNTFNVSIVRIKPPDLLLVLQRCHAVAIIARLVTSPRDPPRSGLAAAADKGGGRQCVFW